MRRSHIMLFLAIISIGDGVLIGVLVGAASRSPAMGLLVGAASAGATWGIIVAIGTSIVRFGTWAALWRRYPALDGVEFGRGSRVISLALGHPWWQINNAVEARADDAHLHLRLAVPALGDDRPISIPWEAVVGVAPASFGRAKLDIEGIAIWLPRVLVKNEMALREAMTHTDDANPGVEVAR